MQSEIDQSSCKILQYLCNQELAKTVVKNSLNELETQASQSPTE